MIFFSLVDGVILSLVLIILVMIMTNIIKNFKSGACSSCSIYKKSVKKQNALIDFYNKVKDKD